MPRADDRPCTPKGICMWGLSSSCLRLVDPQSLSCFHRSLSLDSFRRFRDHRHQPSSRLRRCGGLYACPFPVGPDDHFLRRRSLFACRRLLVCYRVPRSFPGLSMLLLPYRFQRLFGPRAQGVLHAQPPFPSRRPALHVLYSVVGGVNKACGPAFAHTAHTTPAAAASPATARTSATAPSTRPPCGPAPPEPACATPTRLWNTTITRSVANTQHLHTMPCCNTATRPRTEDGTGNSLTLRGKAPAPLARPGTPHNARAKLQCPACCKCHRVQALVQPRTVPARTTAQPTNQPQSPASPSQTRAHPASQQTKPEQPTK